MKILSKLKFDRFFMSRTHLSYTPRITRSREAGPLNTVLENSKPTCPHCRGVVSAVVFQRIQNVHRMVQSLYCNVRVHCPAMKHGCNWTGEPLAVKDHRWGEIIPR